MAAPDPRLTPARSDLAAAHLEGRVEAARFAEGREKVVTAAAAPLTAAPEAEGEMATQLLFGETFTVYDASAGWAWGQAARDGYVGYVPDACLADPGPAPTHRITALQALVYPEDDFRSRPIGALPYGALVAAEPGPERFDQLAVGGWVGKTALAPLGTPAKDWVAEAERMLGAPYLWGGRTPAGIDCSGLIQLALQAAGRDAPRDSDMQEAALGEALPEGAAPQRGDLMFWKGHVGVMTTGKTLLHANLHHMAVAKEPLSAALKRIAALEFGELRRIRRLG